MKYLPLHNVAAPWLGDGSKTSPRFVFKIPGVLKTGINTGCNVIFKRSFILCSTLLLICLSVLFSPPFAQAAAYKEHQLVDGDIYTLEEKSMMVEQFRQKIETIDKQINTLEKNIDWLILKINRIQDTGNIAPEELKQSVLDKEKKISIIQKEKQRLALLAKFYSASQKADNHKLLNQIVEKKMSIARPSPAVKPVKQPVKRPVASPVEQPESHPVNPLGSKTNAVQVKQRELQAELKKAGLDSWVDFSPVDDACVKMKTILPILFPSGTAKMPSHYNDFIEKLGRFLKPYNVKIFVDGYADEVPIKTKKYPSNFELGAQRAANIVHELVKHGVKSSVFKISSMGKYRDSAGGMMSSKAFERKVEITILFRA